VNVRAGVVVAVATLVVKSGERVPALKLVTEPDPPPIEAQPVALPFARMPVGALPVEQRVGVEARAVAVAAFPVVFWFNVGNVALARLMLAGVPIASPEGSVVDSLGTPEPLVTNTALLTGVINPVIFAAV
jgi:hypothetical protein